MRAPTKPEWEHLTFILDNYEYFIGVCECCLTTDMDEDELKVCKEIIRSLNEDSIA